MSRYDGLLDRMATVFEAETARLRRQSHTSVPSGPSGRAEPPIPGMMFGNAVLEDPEVVDGATLRRLGTVNGHSYLADATREIRIDWLSPLGLAGVRAGGIAVRSESDIAASTERPQVEGQQTVYTPSRHVIEWWSATAVPPGTYQRLVTEAARREAGRAALKSEGEVRRALAIQRQARWGRWLRGEIDGDELLDDAQRD
jgi:hypothetical protein